MVVKYGSLYMSGGVGSLVEHQPQVMLVKGGIGPG